ncbi:hypothetical protein GQ56_0136705, partial [Burkholderia paludis]
MFKRWFLRHWRLAILASVLTGGVAFAEDGARNEGVVQPGGRILAALTLHASFPALRNVPSRSRRATATMIDRSDSYWRQTRVQTNLLSFAQRLFPRHVNPSRQFQNGLGASALLRMDVVKGERPAPN